MSDKLPMINEYFNINVIILIDLKQSDGNFVYNGEREKTSKRDVQWGI